MTDEFDPEFDPREVAAAESLDREITELLAGRPPLDTDPVALWLATSLRTKESPALRRRLRPAAGRWPTLARLVAAALALAFAVHGLGNQFASGWIAAGIGEPHAPHVS